MALAFCGSYHINQDGEITSNSDRRTARFGLNQGEWGIFDLDFFLGNMPFRTLITNGASVVFRKPKEKIPEKLFSFRQTSDVFIWTYLLQNKSFAFLNKKLNYFRKHENSTTVKMYKSRMRDVYIEKVHYLNYFKLNYKFIEFTKQYIQSYVWNNKKDALNLEIIRKIENVSFAGIKYYYYLFLFLTKKLLKK